MRRAHEKRRTIQPNERAWARVWVWVSISGVKKDGRKNLRLERKRIFEMKKAPIPLRELGQKGLADRDPVSPPVFWGGYCEPLVSKGGKPPFKRWAVN